MYLKIMGPGGADAELGKPFRIIKVDEVRFHRPTNVSSPIECYINGLERWLHADGMVYVLHDDGTVIAQFDASSDWALRCLAELAGQIKQTVNPNILPGDTGQ